MKLKLFVGAALCAVASIALSGCALGGIKPADLPQMADAFARAGCKGSVHMAAGGASAAGASPGSAHAEFSADGDCDPARAAPALKVGATVAAVTPAQ